MTYREVVLLCHCYRCSDFSPLALLILTTCSCCCSNIGPPIFKQGIDIAVKCGVHLLAGYTPPHFYTCIVDASSMFRYLVPVAVPQYSCWRTQDTTLPVVVHMNNWIVRGPICTLPLTLKQASSCV
jgi:hypothetical protein